MGELRAPGLTADWLNAWLAAVGVTILVKNCRLQWSTDRRPVASFDLPGERDANGAIADALPGEDALRGLVIANADREFPRHVSLHLYERACERARYSGTDGALAASVTDLVDNSALDDSNLPHGRFDPAAPRGETLWNRVLACRRVLPTSGAALEKAVAATLAGRGRRHELNGLGFDARRIEAGDPPSGGKFVDPVVELLAFHGLVLFPVRGDGGRQVLTRGWHRAAAEPGARPRRTTLRWPAWSQPLDRWGIDALLGRGLSAQGQDWSRLGLGITRGFEVVTYRKTGDMDATAGYASRPA